MSENIARHRAACPRLSHRHPARLLLTSLGLAPPLRPLLGVTSPPLFTPRSVARVPIASSIHRTSTRPPASPFLVHGNPHPKPDAYNSAGLLTARCHLRLLPLVSSFVVAGLTATCGTASFRFAPQHLAPFRPRAPYRRESFPRATRGSCSPRAATPHYSSPPALFPGPYALALNARDACMCHSG